VVGFFNDMHRALSTFAVAVLFACGFVSAGSAQQRPAAPPKFWTVGIYTGPSPFHLSPPAKGTNPILRGSDVNDLKVDTLAHPFMVVEGSRYYLFFTAKDYKTDTSGIGMAESTDGVNWKYRHIVVREPFTLAHPFVFKWRKEYYMVPEAHTEKFVRLYRATQFPDKWEVEKDLLTGDTFISPTLLRYKDMWWMFVCRSGNETLRLFYASDFKGLWTEHPRSPVVSKDLRTARPAGRPFVFDGKLCRLAQDCVPTYGYQVRALEVTDISPKTYAEKLIETPLVRASSQGWNASAMHHIDAHEIARGKWIAAVDALGN
jgi:hypothetical protein